MKNVTFLSDFDGAIIKGAKEGETLEVSDIHANALKARGIAEIINLDAKEEKQPRKTKEEKQKLRTK